MTFAAFSHFDKAHLVWLAVSALCVVIPLVCGGGRPVRRKSGTAGNSNGVRTARFLALAVGALHLLLVVVRLAEGTYDIGTLPLHVCGITAYLCVIHAFWPCAFLEGVLFFPGLLGTIAALLFPDWTAYPPFSTLSALGFLGHAAIAAYIVFCVSRGIIRPRGRLIPHSVLFLALYAAVMIPFDRHFSVNYGFLLYPSPGSPLERMADWGDKLAGTLGLHGSTAGYYIVYALTALAVLILWYSLWLAVRRAGNHSTAKEINRE